MCGDAACVVMSQLKPRDQSLGALPSRFSFFFAIWFRSCGFFVFMAESTGSSVGEEPTLTLIKRAACMRTKYRLGNSTMMPLQCLGIHQKNRSGVFPQWQRSQGLMTKIFSGGFCKETAWHQGVCVEEIPPEEQPTDYVNLHTWNKECSSRHPQLEGFLRNPDHVTHGTLSRSHLTLILKLMKNQQRSWPWPDKFKDLVVSKNGLDMTALRERDADLADVLSQGLRMEVLSWKMTKEEPQACSQISQALNMGNEIAMATSEATALATLSETVTFALNNSQMTGRLVRAVAYDAVKESVAVELKEFVHRDSFVDMFEFVINMGANTAPFIPALVAFTSVWVNSELTRLPLTAFKEVNKVSNEFPRTKLAMIQRCYMLPPNREGYVPTPEVSWSKVNKANMSKLENFLKYWEVEVLQSLKPMDTTIAQLANASAATNAANAFIKLAPSDKTKRCELELEILKATLKDYDKICEHLKDQKLPPPPQAPADAEWIDYERAKKHVKEEEEAAKREAEMRPLADKNAPILAKCITYDEEGRPLDEQDAKVKNDTETSMVELPWSSWLGSTVGRDMDLERSLISGVNIALHSLHTSAALVATPIKLVLNETTKKITAVATRDIDASELQLPPCVPGAGSKLHKDTTKPNGVAIQIEESQVHMTPERKKRMTVKTPEGASASSSIKTTKHTYHVFADTKLPEWETLLDDTAVAADRRCRRAMKPFNGKEIMHLFWLLPRLTDKELRARNEDAKGKGGQFNLEFGTIQVGVATIGCMMKKKTNISWSVTVPIITNNKAVKKGDELFLKVAAPPKKEKEPTVETWKAGAKRSATTEVGGQKKQQKGNTKHIDGPDGHNLSLRI
jgi:uncharacterized protein YdhG (YjbR/CyaY superfamily)